MDKHNESNSVCLLFLLGCADQRPDAQEQIDGSKERLSIVATTTQITDIVSQLLGDSCRIYSLMGPGVDPHLYKPTARDMTNITAADLVIYHGLKLKESLHPLSKKPPTTRLLPMRFPLLSPKKTLSFGRQSKSVSGPSYLVRPRFGPNACTGWQICYLRCSLIQRIKSESGPLN